VFFFSFFAYKFIIIYIFTMVGAISIAWKEDETNSINLYTKLILGE